MPWSNTTTGDATNVTGPVMVDIPSDGANVPITLNAGETSNIEIAADFPSSPTDDVIWQVLASVDGGTTWGVQPIDQGRMLNSSDPNSLILSLWGYHVIKVQAMISGITDTVAVTVRVRKDGVNI